MLFYLFFLLCAVECTAMNDFSFLADLPFSASITQNGLMNLDSNDYKMLCKDFLEHGADKIYVDESEHSRTFSKYKYSQVKGKNGSRVIYPPVKVSKGTRGRKGSKYKNSKFACIICSLRFNDEFGYHSHSLKNITHKDGIHDKVYGHSCKLCIPY